MLPKSNTYFWSGGADAPRSGQVGPTSIGYTLPVACGWLETARYPVTLDVPASLAQGLEIPLSELLNFPVPPRPAAA